MDKPTNPLPASEIPSPITSNIARTEQVPAAPIVIQQSRSAFSRLLSWVGWTGFIFCGILLYGLLSQLSDYFDLTGGIAEKYHSGAKFSSDKIAIISVDGTILDGDGFVKKQIDRVREDDQVKAVVLRIDSPGGTVTGSDYIYHHLKKLREEKIEKHGDFPMIVSMGSMAASGGYYIAMAVGDQEKSIYAEPTTTTGSIGVIIPHYDVTGLMEKYGVKDDSIPTHPRKQMLSMTRPLTEEHREILKAYIGESFDRFKDIIKQGRPHFQKDSDALNQLATGEVFTANQAKKHGLIDEIGFIEAAIDRALELASLDKENTRVVEFHEPNKLFDLGFVQAPSGHISIDLGRLIDLSSPKAYYLSTSLPALAASER